MSEYEKFEWREWLKAAAIRALWSFLEVIAFGIPAGATIFSIDWHEILGVAIGAAVVSFCKSLLVGMPEADTPSQLTKKFQ